MAQDESLSNDPEESHRVLKAILRQSTNLDLSGAGLRDLEIMDLAEALSGRAEALNIETINLTGNSFSGKGTVAIANALTIFGFALRELKLDERNIDDPEAIVAVDKIRRLKPYVRITGVALSLARVVAAQKEIGSSREVLTSGDGARDLALEKRSR